MLRFHRAPVVWVCAVFVANVSGKVRTIDPDPQFAMQWGLHNTGQFIGGQTGIVGADIRAVEAWNIHPGSSSVVVAVVDAGVDPHPEFADRLLEGYVPAGVGGDLRNTLDTGLHGTHVAGIIGATTGNGAGIAGICSDVWLMPVRVLNDTSGSQATTASGIFWAVDHGADVVVVPLSFSSPPSQLLVDAVAYAVANDVVVIAPAGNNGDSEVACPARIEGCLAVTATTNRDEFAADVSNYGAQVDLSAPGWEILSTSRGGDYEYQSSAAVATGFVGGVAALVRSFAPQLSAAQVAQLLIDTADDLGSGGWDVYFGAGRLNAWRALDTAPAPALRIERVDPLPETVTPGVWTSFVIRVADGAEAVESAALHYRGGAAEFVTTPLARLRDGDFAVELPPIPCGATLEYYFSAAGSGRSIITDPFDAPDGVHSAYAIRQEVLLYDDFEEDRGWTTLPEGALNSEGAWIRVVPVGTTGGSPSGPVQPAYDYSTDAGQFCFVTGQDEGGKEGSADVDGGPVRLLSPVISLNGLDAEVSYARWFFSFSGELDELVVEMSRDAGASWTEVETVETNRAWIHRSFYLSNFPHVAGDQLQIRFTTSDLNGPSLTEAAIDEFRVRAIQCSSSPAKGDYDGSLSINLTDFGALTWCMTGPEAPLVNDWCAVLDFDDDGDVDLTDYRAFLLVFGGN